MLIVNSVLKFCVTQKIACIIKKILITGKRNPTMTTRKESTQERHLSKIFCRITGMGNTLNTCLSLAKQGPGTSETVCPVCLHSRLKHIADIPKLSCTSYTAAI